MTFSKQFATESCCCCMVLKKQHTVLSCLLTAQFSIILDTCMPVERGLIGSIWWNLKVLINSRRLFLLPKIERQTCEKNKYEESNDDY